jgi:hypothetical protein
MRRRIARSKAFELLVYFRGGLWSAHAFPRPLRLTLLHSFT